VRLSGPVVRDRLWYSAAYDPRVDQADEEVPGHGLFAGRRTVHLFAGKLTWQAAPRANVELSVFGDPTLHHQVDVPAGIPTGVTVLYPDRYLRRLESGVTGSLRAAVDLGPRVWLEGALAYARP